jgi:hypothetical protein
MSGLGNSIGYFTREMLTGALAGRALSSARNRPECSAACVQLDPAAYNGAWGGTAAGVADWRWRDDAAELARRGVSETVLEVDVDPAGFFLVTGLLVPGALDLLALLSHEAVAPLPWSRVRLPPAEQSAAISSRGVGEALIAAPLQAALDVRLATDAATRGGACDADARRKCGMAAFLFPLLSFQSIMMPYVARLDAAGAAGATTVGVYVRSGFAADVAPAAAQAPPVRYTLRNATPAVAWAHLNAAFEPCADASGPHKLFSFATRSAACGSRRRRYRPSGVKSP